MELFKITCLTCRARLSVRDAALVGQIIGCPKCGMMVQVTPPSDLAASPAGVTVAAATTASPKSPEPAEAVSNATEQSQPFDEGAETSASTFDDANQVFAAVDNSNELQPATAASVTTVAPIGGWSGFKLAAMLISAAVVGATLVGAGITLLRDDAIVAEEGNAATAPMELAAASPPDGSIDDLASTEEPAVVEVAKPVGAEAFLPVKRAREDGADEQQPVSDKAAPIADPQTHDSSPAEDEAAPEVDRSEPASEPAPAALENEPRLRIDPLDMDPEGLNLSTLYGSAPKDPIAESQLPAEEARASSAPTDEPADVPADAPPEAPEAVRRDEQAGGGAPTAVDALLARRLPEISITKTPLCRFIDLATQLSGLPISVDAEELRMAAVTAAAPVSVDVKDATIEQLLTAALEPLRFKPVVEGEQILLKRSGEDARRTVEYPVEDLGGSPEEVEQLGDWIVQLASPEEWSQRGGDATLDVEDNKLRVEAPTSVQYEVLFVLERYRLARALPTRTKYPSSLLSAEPLHSAIAERLSTPAQFTFSQYTPLREVFRLWQEELEVAVLVDWPALAGERLWPQSRIACSAADKPFSAAMDSVLGPLGLAWRAVDQRTIEITTRAKVNAEPQFDVYRVRANAALDEDQFTERLQSLSAPEAAQAAAGAAVFYDAGSRILLTRQPAAVHRRVVAEMGDVLELDARGAAAQ